MKHMAAGVRSFAPVLTNKLDEFRQVLLTHEIEEEEDDKQEFSNDEGEEDELCDAVENSDMPFHSEDIVLDALSHIGAAPLLTS